MDRARRVGYLVAQTHLSEYTGDVELYPEAYVGT
jgi:hypothetical protein